MQLSLSTWNSLNINDGSIYKAHIPVGQMANLSANPVTVNRALAFPFLSTTVLNPHVFVIQVTIVAGQNINTYRETLKKYFNIMDTQRHTLVALDLADSNKPYYLTGLPIRISPEGDSPNSFFITLAVETPVWQLVTATTDNWNITASGQTNAFTNAGNINVKPKIVLTPTTTKSGGLTYRRWVPIYNNLDESFVAPWDITSGGFDTATLTTAKMQADGDDFLVMMDGVFVDRWLYNMDAATTQCWINLNLSPRREGTTSVTIAGSGAVSTISFAQTRANLSFLQAMARVTNKVVLIDSEAFTFTGVDLVGYQLTGCTRAQKDTSMAAHTAPKTARWIEHDIWILYGDSTLTAPDVDDDYKPIFALSSTNASWVYTTELYSDPLYGTYRGGMWMPSVISTKTGLSHFYTTDQGNFVDPADKLGLAIVNTDNTYGVNVETAQLEWSLSHPVYFTSVTYSGSRISNGSWPEVIGVQGLESNVLWISEYEELPPPVMNSWQAISSHVVTFVGYYKKIRFVIDGSISPAPGEYVKIQFDTITVAFNSGSLPTGSIGAETAINWFDAKITNNTTGLYLKVKAHCLVTTGNVTIDCEAKKAYMQDGARIPVTLSTEREAWLDLNSGSNTLQFDDTGTVAVTLALTHRDGNL